MSYTTIHTKYSVGDTVYFHDSEADSVHRGVVTGIEAQSRDAGYSPKWSVLYTVAHKFASNPPARSALVREEDLHDDALRVWPAIVEVAEVQA